MNYWQIANEPFEGFIFMLRFENWVLKINRLPFIVVDQIHIGRQTVPNEGARILCCGHWER